MSDHAGNHAPNRPLARLGGLLITLLLHILFFLFAWVELRPHGEPPPPPPPDSDVLQVQLLSAPRQPAASPAPPPPAAAPTPVTVAPPPARHPQQQPTARPQPPHALRPRPAARPEPVRAGEMTASVAPAKKTPPPPRPEKAPQLFDANGNPILPAQIPPAGHASDYIARDQQGDTQIMQHTDPTHYQATRFDASWHRPGVVDRAVEKAVKATSVGHTFHLPMGVRIHCSVSLVGMGGGCGGDPPPPPSKKDGDERLSMAPASLLAKNPHAPPPPPVARCIAAYRAELPLPQGCPVDTPLRAVDQEAKERAEQQRRQMQWGH